MHPPPPLSTPFPYTTLFRSASGDSNVRFVEFFDPSSEPYPAAPPFGPYGLAIYDAAGHNLGSQTLDASKLASASGTRPRSEEHTSELQSRGHLVCRLLLEQK